MTNPVDVGDVYSLNVYGEIFEKALLKERRRCNFCCNVQL